MTRTPRIGELITYETFSGSERQCRISGLGMESGEPVFDAVESGTKEKVWGYWSQITAYLPTAGLPVYDKSRKNIPMKQEYK
jgi:hypothetical protein